MTPGDFRLRIELGNAAMLTPDDVARALRIVAGHVEAGGHQQGRITDANGNTVGGWIVTGREDDAPEAA